MINWIKGIHHPEAYHGINSRPPFFEGWYHKIVTKSGHPFAIIPGIYRSAKVENKFPFVMIFDGQSGDVHFERFIINWGKQVFYLRARSNNLFSKAINRGITKFLQKYPMACYASRARLYGLVFIHAIYGMLSWNSKYAP